MARQRLEVADVVRAHRERFIAARGGRLSAAERRVLDDLAACRTAACGGHVERCDACGFERIAYNSCRNRHCPKCQGAARAAWLAEREAELLPVGYFHVVFTLPHELGALALQNKQTLYALLFRAVAQTLTTIAADPRRLGAEIGVIAVLHTWGQNLEHHPHIHCLIPGGGLAFDQSRWVPCRRRFFLPVRVLARYFRGAFLRELGALFEAGALQFHGQRAHLVDPAAFRAFLAPLARRPWYVYAQPPFGGPGPVLRYLARYTHRVAIANSRLVAMDDERVTFRWKDYRVGDQPRLLTLSAIDFLGRFLLHLLPRGFQHVRHYGFLANRSHEAKLARSRQLLAAMSSAHDATPAAQATPAAAERRSRCPHCPGGRLVCVLVFTPGVSLQGFARPPLHHDTS